MKIRIITAVLLAACVSTARAATDEPIQPIQPVKEINLAKADLGKQLFFDGRLSRSGILSCATCHNLAQAGVDNLQYSVGDRWKLDDINTPTVYNSSLNFVQFWDGRASDLQ
ncbi:MAG TPA: cytochrome-c peroxidase, partial [Methylococcales bacterium]